MFDKHLFYALCEKYGVELSEDYTKNMVEVDGKIREITEQDMLEILAKAEYNVKNDRVALVSETFNDLRAMLQED